MDRSAKECSGCMACKSICPENCIHIRTDRAGNFVRLIDDEKCMKCGRCKVVCPLNRQERMSTPRKAYIAWSKKKEKRSSSGGIAGSIYRYCLSNRIACIGVRYDEDFSVKYDFVDSVKDIEKFEGSKYVYSHMRIYRKILSKLKYGKKVVFIGLPCHVAALRNVVGRYNDNLICIDLVCHGVAPEKFLAEHMSHIYKKIKCVKVTSIDFREEENPYGITVKGEKSEILKRRPRWLDEYMLGYCEGFTYCESCYSCKYARKERCADLTIKDFSGELPRGKRIPRASKLSNILVNTDRGARFITEMKPYWELIDDSVDRVIASDAMLRRPTPRGKRKWFVRLYPFLGFDNTIRILCFDTIIKGWIKNVVGN